MELGMRAHDLEAVDIQNLCTQLGQLNIHSIQFAPGKSFPSLNLTAETIREMKRVLDAYDIRVAVLGCYIDPLTLQGEERFLREMEYASILQAGVIGTETSLVQCPENTEESQFQKIKEKFSKWASCAAHWGVSIGVEAVTGFPIDSVEKTARLLAELPPEHFKVIWDPANLIDRDNMAVQQEVFADGLNRYGSRIAAVHYKNRPDIYYKSSIDFCVQNPKIPILLEGITKSDVCSTLEQIRSLADGKGKTENA